LLSHGFTPLAAGSARIASRSTLLHLISYRDVTMKERARRGLLVGLEEVPQEEEWQVTQSLK
jgi:hypothetical protein